MRDCPVGLDAVSDAFWRRLAAAPQAVLMLDYDGTLAPFRTDRDRAVPYAGIRERLERLRDSGRTRLLLISGRPIADVENLLAIDPLPEVWGIHGFERWTPAEGLRRATLEPAARDALKTASEVCGELLDDQRIERKAAAIALHWRGLASDAAAQLRGRLERALEPLTRQTGLELNLFDGGLELRVAGITKERAVRCVGAEAGEEAVMSYLGDDLTDEDAFRALGSEDLPVLVRAEPRSTAARLRLVPPQDVLGFLDRWLAKRTGRANA